MKLDSTEWSEKFGIVVTDPDGWDRQNFAESWDEKITESEFIDRLRKSTSFTPPTKKEKGVPGLVEWVLSKGGTVSQFNQHVLFLEVFGVKSRYFVTENWVGVKKEGCPPGKAVECRTLEEFITAVSGDEQDAQNDDDKSPSGLFSGRLPAPRLQLRWTAADVPEDGEWLCHYELVIPLGKDDIRREIYDHEGDLVGKTNESRVTLKEPTSRSGGGIPCTAPDGTRYCDAPFRDGAHAQWDSEAMGGFPIFVIAPDGSAFQLS